MPTLMPTDTKAALGTNAEKCDSRSLLLDRFADPAAKGTDRQALFKRAFSKQIEAKKVASWSRFAEEELRLEHGGFLYAQLQSRLMVNMAGGVMENAGLCLDRFGLPYIPGSGNKGCARRAATQALVEVQSPPAKASLLFNLCLVFGWGDTDWKVGRKTKRKDGRVVETEPWSDFWWAMAPDTGDRPADDQQRNQVWRQVATAVANRLLDHLRFLKREHPEDPCRDLPNFAGCVSFLPAYPMDFGKTVKLAGLSHEVPELGKLELDVITVHHKKYYEGDDPAYASAPDTEEPVPNVFPAVRAGHVFAFAVAPLRGADPKLLAHARTWLACGTSTFGLGAKANAGYGWFQDVTKPVADWLARQRELGEIQSTAAKFSELSDDDRLEFILKLSAKSEVCRAWRELHPDTARVVYAFAQELESPLP